jgi:hypothetical protein
MPAWFSLYFAHMPDAASRLAAWFAAEDWAAYNPFVRIPTRTPPHTVRAFAAPAVGGWVRVLVAPDEAAAEESAWLPAAQALSAEPGTGVLALALAADGGAFVQAWAEGAPVQPDRLIAFRAPDADPSAVTGPADSETIGGVPLAALPAEVRALAERTGMSGPAEQGEERAKMQKRGEQGEALFAKMAAPLARRTGMTADESAAARALLGGGAAWESAGGRHVRETAARLLSPGWHTPDYVTVRDAWSAASRLAQRPGARLYPGDAEALAAVPDPLAYTPLFFGRGAR